MEFLVIFLIIWQQYHFNSDVPGTILVLSEVKKFVLVHVHPIGHKKCGLSRQVVSGDRFSYIEM